MNKDGSLLSVLNERERMIGSTAVRVQVDGIWENAYLSDLPGYVAIHEFCKIIRALYIKREALKQQREEQEQEEKAGS